MKFLLASLTLASLCRGYGSQSYYNMQPQYANYRQPQAGQNPFFQNSPGRFSGNTGQLHSQSEVIDSNGQVQGSYSFSDPNNRDRTYGYTLDNDGFHQSPTNYASMMRQRSDNEANRLATDRHHTLYEQIAASNLAAIPTHDTDSVANAKISHHNLYNQIAASNLAAIPTHDTDSVANAKVSHHNLYNKIAGEHAAIGAERALLLTPNDSNQYRRAYSYSPGSTGFYARGYQ